MGAVSICAESQSDCTDHVQTKSEIINGLCKVVIGQWLKFGGEGLQIDGL